jgi:hypothetical protein
MSEVIICKSGKPRRECPGCSLSVVVTFDARDWSLVRADAWLYGIICGWDDGSLAELEQKRLWGVDDTRVLKRLRAEFVAAFPCQWDEDVDPTPEAI